MKHALRTLLCLAAASLLTGCISSGLSFRERGARSQGAYLDAMYADVGSSSLNQRRAPFAAPASLAVAQIGEVSPPAVMISQLREHSAQFRRVQAIPATADGTSHWNRGPDDASIARSRINALRGLAASTGADYLLLVGGTVDQTESGTPLSVLNLTIVGLFIVPSHETTALMKASGALIDVRTGQVISISSAEIEESQLAPLISNDGQMARRLNRMRNKVTVSLADAVAVDCTRVGEATPTTDGYVPASPASAEVSAQSSAASSPLPQKRTYQGR